MPPDDDAGRPDAGNGGIPTDGMPPSGTQDLGVWFEQVFPEGRGFTDWLDTSEFWTDLEKRGEVGGDVRREMRAAAQRDPNWFWNSMLSAEGRQGIRARYDAEWWANFGDTTDVPLEEQPPAIESPPEGWAQIDASQISVTLPDRSRLTEAIDSDGSGTVEQTLTDRAGNVVGHEEVEVEPLGPTPPSAEPMSSAAALLPPWVLALGGAAIVAAIISFLLFGGGGDDSDDDAIPGGTVGAASGEPTTVGAANACEAVRSQQLILDVSSNEVGPTIPTFYAMHLRDENGFPAPGLMWSAVPPETTEIAILVLSLNEERAASYEADPDLWWDGRDSVGTPSGIPLGATRWTLTGLGADVTTLEATSRSRPPPDGTTEHFLNGTGTERDGVDLSHKFIGPSSDSDTYLFTVFALCDPVPGDPDDYTGGWFKRHSIATGWFFSPSAPFGGDDASRSVAGASVGALAAGYRGRAGREREGEDADAGDRYGDAEASRGVWVAGLGRGVRRGGDRDSRGGRSALGD